jgi:hypothetical protein
MQQSQTSASVRCVRDIAFYQRAMSMECDQFTPPKKKATFDADLATDPFYRTAKNDYFER